MKKTLATLLLAGSLFSCSDPGILNPNTEEETLFYPDTSEVPVERNDLIMYMELRKMEVGKVMEYTGKIQTINQDTVEVNNMDRRIRYTAFKDGKEFSSREELENALFGLYDNGYFQSTTDDTLVYFEISNARITYVKNGDTLSANIPFPLKLEKTLPRSKYYESEIIQEEGLYHFEVFIPYSVNDSLFSVKFISDSVQVGGLGKRIMPIKLKMRKE